jgi:hypothetical protein
MISSFNELPKAIKDFYSSWIKDEKEREDMVRGRIPALGNKSILEVINEENGLEKVVIYINRMSGKSGIPLSIMFNEITHQYELVDDTIPLNWNGFPPKE